MESHMADWHPHDRNMEVDVVILSWWHFLGGYGTFNKMEP